MSAIVLNVTATSPKTAEKVYREFLELINHSDKTKLSPQEFDAKLKALRQDLLTYQSRLDVIARQEHDKDRKKTVEKAKIQADLFVKNSASVLHAFKSLTDDHNYPALWMPGDTSLVNTKLAKRVAENATEKEAKKCVQKLVKSAEKHNATMLKIAVDYIRTRRVELSYAHKELVNLSKDIQRVTRTGQHVTEIHRPAFNKELEQGTNRYKLKVSRYNMNIQKFTQESRSICIASAESGLTRSTESGVQSLLTKALQIRDKLKALLPVIINTVKPVYPSIGQYAIPAAVVPTPVVQGYKHAESSNDYAHAGAYPNVMQNAVAGAYQGLKLAGPVVADFEGEDGEMDLERYRLLDDY